MKIGFTKVICILLTSSLVLPPQLPAYSGAERIGQGRSVDRFASEALANVAVYIQPESIESRISGISQICYKSASELMRSELGQSSAVSSLLIFGAALIGLNRLHQYDESTLSVLQEAGPKISLSHIFSSYLSPVLFHPMFLVATTLLLLPFGVYFAYVLNGRRSRATWARKELIGDFVASLPPHSQDPGYKRRKREGLYEQNRIVDGKKNSEAPTGNNKGLAQLINELIGVGEWAALRNALGNRISNEFRGHILLSEDPIVALRQFVSKQENAGMRRSSFGIRVADEISLQAIKDFIQAWQNKSDPTVFSAQTPLAAPHLVLFIPLGSPYDPLVESAKTLSVPIIRGEPQSAFTLDIASTKNAFPWQPKTRFTVGSLSGKMMPRESPTATPENLALALGYLESYRGQDVALMKPKSTVPKAASNLSPNPTRVYAPLATPANLRPIFSKSLMPSDKALGEISEALGQGYGLPKVLQILQGAGIRPTATLRKAFLQRLDWSATLKFSDKSQALNYLKQTMAEHREEKLSAQMGTAQNGSYVVSVRRGVIRAPHSGVPREVKVISAEDDDLRPTETDWGAFQKSSFHELILISPDGKSKSYAEKRLTWEEVASGKVESIENADILESAKSRPKFNLPFAKWPTRIANFMAVVFLYTILLSAYFALEQNRSKKKAMYYIAPRFA